MRTLYAIESKHSATFALEFAIESMVSPDLSEYNEKYSGLFINASLILRWDPQSFVFLELKYSWLIVAFSLVEMVSAAYLTKRVRIWMFSRISDSGNGFRINNTNWRPDLENSRFSEIQFQKWVDILEFNYYKTVEWIVIRNKLLPENTTWDYLFVFSKSSVENSLVRELFAGPCLLW